MELTSLVAQFGPWVGLAVYGVLAFLNDRKRREDALALATKAHLDDLRGAIAEGRATGSLMAEVVTELRELRKEIRSLGTDADSEPPEAPTSHRGRSGR